MPKQKQKLGSTAIPFLLTVLISLIVIGGTALFIFERIEKDDSSEPESVDKIEYFTPTAEDSSTLMLILDLEDGVSPITFMVLRIDPEMRRYVCIPIASTTINYDGHYVWLNIIKMVVLSKLKFT